MCDLESKERSFVSIENLRRLGFYQNYVWTCHKQWQHKKKNRNYPPQDFLCPSLHFFSSFLAFFLIYVNQSLTIPKPPKIKLVLSSGVLLVFFLFKVSWLNLDLVLMKTDVFQSLVVHRKIGFGANQDSNGRW